MDLPTPVSPPIKDEAAALQTAGRWILAAACLSACCLLGLTLFAGPLVLDECGTYWILDSEVPSTVWERSLGYAAIPPLSSWIDQAWISMGGKHEWVLRTPSMLFALLAVFVIYNVGKNLGHSVSGGLAALLLAWHPEALDEVRIARCYGLVLFLSAALLWATIRWWRSAFSWRDSIIWALVSLALLWTHYTTAMLVAVCAAVAVWNGRLALRMTGQAWLRIGTTFVVVVGLCVPLISPVLRLMEWGPALNYSPPSSSFWNLKSIVGPVWWAGLPAGIAVAWIVGRQRATDVKIDRQTLLLVATCACVPLIVFAAMSFGSLSSLANPRYRLAYVPAATCLMSAILASVRGRLAVASGAVVTIAIAWLLSPSPPWELTRLSNPKDREWHELNLLIRENAADQEPILVQSGLTEGHLVPAYADDRLFMEYVACRVTRFYVDTPHPRYALPFVWMPETGMIDFYLEHLRAWRPEPGGFWVAAAIDTDLNLNSVAGIRQLALSAGYEEVAAWEWPSAILLRFRHAEHADAQPPMQ